MGDRAFLVVDGASQSSAVRAWRARMGVKVFVRTIT